MAMSGLDALALKMVVVQPTEEEETTGSDDDSTPMSEPKPTKQRKHSAEIVEEPPTAPTNIERHPPRNQKVKPSVGLHL